MHEHEHMLILKKPTCNHSLLAPLLQHILASFCKVSLVTNMDKQILFSPSCCLSSRGQRQVSCVAGPHTVWSARVNSIQKSHTCLTNSRRTHPDKDPAPCLVAGAAKVLLACSADCWLQTLSRGEIFWSHCLSYARPLAAGAWQPYALHNKREG